MAVLVDSNVLLDVLTDDPSRGKRSAAALAALAEDDILAINPVIYAEVSIGFLSIEEIDVALPATMFHRLPLPCDAGFLAGKAFLHCRRRVGLRSSALPDFYTGAHASVAGLCLLTRDRDRKGFRGHFSKLKLIHP